MTQLPKINLRDLGGVASHRRVAVDVDGVQLGEINYTGPSGQWRIVDSYSQQLGRAATLNEARQKALTLTYPTRREAYERLHEKVYQSRRRAAEAQSGPRLAELTRELLAGSNSAREEIEKLLEQIDVEARTQNLGFHIETRVSRYPRPPHLDFNEFREIEIVDRQPMKEAA